MQRRYATRDNERQMQGGGQRSQYRRDFDEEAMQRDFSAYDQEDEYGTRPSRERGEREGQGAWQADWSEAGRARIDDPRNERNERHGNSGDSRYGYSRDTYGRSQAGQNRDAYGARSGSGGAGGYGRSYGRDYGRDYEDAFMGEYGGDYGGDFSTDYGRDYGRDYDRDYGSRVSQGGGRRQSGGQSMQRGPQGWEGRESQAQQRGYGNYGSYGSQGGHGGASMDMRHRQGPKGYSRSDERIREDVCERLCMAHELEVHDVSVQVKDGRVDLQGSVPERWMKHAIEDCAEQCFGVQDVENRIRTQSSHGDHPHGGTGSGTSASQRTSGQTGTVGTPGAQTASSAAGSTGSSSGTSGSGNDAGKHH